MGNIVLYTSMNNLTNQLIESRELLQCNRLSNCVFVVFVMLRQVMDESDKDSTSMLNKNWHLNYTLHTSVVNITRAKLARLFLYAR
jgi:hypothetical protein